MLAFILSVISQTLTLPSLKINVHHIPEFKMYLRKRVKRFDWIFNPLTVEMIRFTDKPRGRNIHTIPVCAQPMEQSNKLE